MTRKLLPCVLASLGLLAIPEDQLSAMSGPSHGAILRVHLVDRGIGETTRANAEVHMPQKNHRGPRPEEALQVGGSGAGWLVEMAHPPVERSDSLPATVSSWLGTLTLSNGALSDVATVLGLPAVVVPLGQDREMAAHFSAVPAVVGSDGLTRVELSDPERYGLAEASDAEFTRGRPAGPPGAASLIAPRIAYRVIAFDHVDEFGEVTWSGPTGPDDAVSNISQAGFGAASSDRPSFALLAPAPLVTGENDPAWMAEREGRLFAYRRVNWHNAGRRLASAVLAAVEERGTALALALDAIGRQGAAQAPARPDRSDLTDALPKAIEQRVQKGPAAENFGVVQLIERDVIGRSDTIAVSTLAQAGQDRSPAWLPLRQQGEAALVQLGALAELLTDHFEPEELARIRASSARYSYLPQEELQAADIPVAFDALSQQLQLDLVAAQSGSGEAGAGLNGLGGGSAIKRNLTATASAGFDNNPFLSPNGNAEAASLRLQLAPSLSYADTRNTVRLGGRVEHIEYLGRYSSLQNYGADLSGSHRINERLQANAGLLFNSNILATNLANPFFQNDDLLPDQPVPPAGNDVTLLGQQQRRTQYGADGGLRYTLSERDELQWATSFRADRFGNGGLAESDFLSQQLRYSRQINSGTNVGAIVNVSIINFSDPAFGDARTITPQLLVTTSLSPRLEATGSVGVAFTRIGQGANALSDTALSGNLSLCYQGELSGFCLTGARQVLPSAIGGARLQTTGGVTYSLRMSERETLRLGGNYSTASQPLSGFGGGDFESINGFARYERRLDERMRIFVSGGFLETSGNLPGNASNVQGLVGVVADFGSAR